MRDPDHIVWPGVGPGPLTLRTDPARATRDLGHFFDLRRVRQPHMGRLRRLHVGLIVMFATGSLVSACGAGETTQTGSHPAKGVRTTATTATTIASGTVPPTPSPAPDNCRSGSVTVAASLPILPPPVCVHSGATLTVDFDKSNSRIGVPGPWAVPPLAVTPNGFLTVSRTTESGDHLTATFAATAPGTATVSSYFDNECAPTDTTPCTIPPLNEINLRVTVVGP